MANGALYFPEVNVDLSSVLGEVRTDAPSLGKPTFFEWQLEAGTVRLNVMPAEDVPNHLMGFHGYVRKLPGEKEPVLTAISKTKTVLGLVTTIEFNETNGLWRSLLAIAAANQGFIFAYNSVWASAGDCLIVPMKDTTP